VFMRVLIVLASCRHFDYERSGPHCTASKVQWGLGFGRSVRNSMTGSERRVMDVASVCACTYLLSRVQYCVENGRVQGNEELQIEVAVFGDSV